MSLQAAKVQSPSIKRVVLDTGERKVFGYVKIKCRLEDRDWQRAVLQKAGYSFTGQVVDETTVEFTLFVTFSNKQIGQYSPA